MYKEIMYEYIFTIGCFDRLHNGHIKLLESLKSKCKKLIVGLHDNKSIEKLKSVNDIQELDIRKKNVEKYAFDVFIINDIDPTDSIKKYVKDNFNDYEPIVIGPSVNNKKMIDISYKTKLYFTHDYNDRFEYVYYNNNKLIVKRTNSQYGWGQNLIGYKMNWCFMRGDDNKNFPSKDYVSSIMPIKYLPYSNNISTSRLRNYKNDKLGLMNYLLQKVVNVLNDNNIPYYLDCGTLLGCIREKKIMEKDTDVDVTVHLSMWDKLNSINFNNYELIRTRTLKGFPNKVDGNMISVKTKYSNIYCDIYTNPAFPLLENMNLNGNSYFIPKNSELYLKQLYGNWMIPSENHASTEFHRGKGLVESEYSKYWDKKYKIFKNLKY